MEQPISYQAVAFNEAPDSENRIHGDDVAAQFGFEGGLVPGVTVSAYLAHPAVEAWGLDYLASGAAEIVVESPVYDEQLFSVDVLVDADAKPGYTAILKDASGSVRARGKCWIPSSLPEAPQQRGDAILPPNFDRPIGTPDTMLRLQQSGMRALQICWNDTAELTTYFRDPECMSAPLKRTGGCYAHLGFVLGLTNWALGSNVQLTTWLHLQTESQCFSAIEYGTELFVESAIADLFEKKGHHFCDVDVAAFRTSDGSPVMQARMRAIYQLRGA